MSVQIKNVKDKSLEDICLEADEIYGKMLELIDQKMAPDAIGKIIYPQYKDFVSTYPTVIQYMLHKCYDKPTLAKWLKNLKPWTKESEFLERQAQYAAMLMKALNPKASNKDIAEFRRKVNKQLLEDRENFKKEVDKAQKEIEIQEELAFIDRKKDLLKLLEKGQINQMEYKAEYDRLETPPNEKRQAVIDRFKSMNL